jgi:hypothetical protein
MGCSGLCALDRINLSFSTERAQGHFLSPALVEEWSPLHKRTAIFSLCVSVRLDKSYCWYFEKIANFFLCFSLLSEYTLLFGGKKRKTGVGHGGDSGGGRQGKVAKEHIAKEKRKALDDKSAGTQHRHPRGKSPPHLVTPEAS